MRFFLGPLIIVGGVLMMKYTVQITNYTGKIGFAEKYLGGGTAAGTYTWWRLLGLAFCILAVLWMMGILSFGPDSANPTPAPLEPLGYIKTHVIAGR